jgi:hypothetical protein
MKKLSILLLVFTFVGQYLVAQTSRNAIATHGFEGSNASYQVYASYYQSTRPLTFLKTDYNSLTGVPTAASKVISDITTALGTQATNPQNIAIAHSMGAAVTREIDRMGGGANGSPYFGGMILEGCPNKGAPFVNEAAVNGFLGEAETALSAGPSTAPLINFLTWLVSGENVKGFFNSFKTSIQDKIGPIANSPTANDLRENSLFINQLNAYSNNKPKIAIYGAEESPVHLRWASSFMKTKPTNAPLNQPVDNHFVDKASQIKGVYQSFVDLNNFKYIASLGFGKKFKKNAFAWAKGRDFIIDGSEVAWLTLLKSQHTVSTTVTTTGWICSFPFLSQQFYTFVNNGGTYESCLGQVTTTTVQVIVDPTDGLMNKSTAAGLAGAAKVYQADKVNHQELMNHKSVTDIFDQIFDGAVPGTSWFKAKY